MPPLLSLPSLSPPSPLPSPSIPLSLSSFQAGKDEGESQKEVQSPLYQTDLKIQIAAKEMQGIKHWQSKFIVLQQGV